MGTGAGRWDDEAMRDLGLYLDFYTLFANDIKILVNILNILNIMIVLAEILTLG